MQMPIRDGHFCNMACHFGLIDAEYDKLSCDCLICEPIAFRLALAFSPDT